MATEEPRNCEMCMVIREVAEVLMIGVVWLSRGGLSSELSLRLVLEPGVGWWSVVLDEESVGKCVEFPLVSSESADLGISFGIATALMSPFWAKSVSKGCLIGCIFSASFWFPRLVTILETFPSSTLVVGVPVLVRFFCLTLSACSSPASIAFKSCGSPCSSRYTIHVLIYSASEHMSIVGCSINRDRTSRRKMRRGPQL
ncbi:hypothetical protein H113_04915 [Trichophyton rubrum MR1459]|uniref:Uncharacterized protein n=1 Tax=Trichophyton rubrum (strain ATCC MYA-4607 / CBS 118892) TaxID=559305 RepID=A0A080WGQ5_TRIRC|nr:uncharacterized protein TERG_12165 [Trichophyton rubrum CBS 118892]EZF94513.1 hypothetical protein H113_04915 [Trichophyton rubrum MR1459]EZG00728.1 hypothetical protein H106_08933 [Trichophyton rubrum CBS 735.88]KFL61671.1 hypothetical protein TERG_12165 [Trichophyton rubrum CBS 118892]